MKVISRLRDERIGSDNYLLDVTIGEYLDLVEGVLAQNEFQRRRVQSSRTIYSLLKQDIQKGCVIPPIVLALTSIDAKTKLDENTITKYILAHKNNLVILDGLQRTYSLVDLSEELHASKDEQNYAKVRAQKIRVEIYVGINRVGILYRMLTLNTGQTPMSLRQQIEMLYLDYAKIPMPGIVLIREAEGKYVNEINEYNFREIIEGFNSYLERNELPIERADLLENIKSLEKLSQENAESDIFKDYVETWHSFIEKIDAVTKGAELPEDFEQNNGMIWGATSVEAFKRAQSISGFGAAIGKLKDFGLIKGFDDIKAAIKTIESPPDKNQFLNDLNRGIATINNSAKKIGNAQRMYFLYYFRELFNPQGDSYRKPYQAIASSFQKYLSQNT